MQSSEFHNERTVAMVGKDFWFLNLEQVPLGLKCGGGGMNQEYR